MASVYQGIAPGRVAYTDSPGTAHLRAPDARSASEQKEAAY